jgi:hypothetical protein
MKLRVLDSPAGARQLLKSLEFPISASDRKSPPGPHLGCLSYYYCATHPSKFTPTLNYVHIPYCLNCIHHGLRVLPNIRFRVIFQHLRIAIDRGTERRRGSVARAHFAMIFTIMASCNIVAPCGAKEHEGRKKRLCESVFR